MEAFIKKYFIILIVLAIVGWILFENSRRAKKKKHDAAKKDIYDSQKVKAAVKELRSRKNDYVQDQEEDENPLHRGEFTSDTDGDEVAQMYEDAVNKYMANSNYDVPAFNQRLQNHHQDTEEHIGDDAGEFLTRQEYDEHEHVGDLDLK